MKKTHLLLVLAGALTTGFLSCKKNSTETVTHSLSAEERSKINACGLSSANAYRTDGGYIAEGDIFLSDEDLRTIPANKQTLQVGREEQYRVANLVTGLPRTISIRYTGTLASFSAALNQAIARFNAQALQLTFVRVAATAAANITVMDVSGVAYMALAGFPSAAGNPYNSIRFNTAFGGWAPVTLATVMAHEIGHCIGFAHTDFMNPAFSCGTGSPGAGPYINIPGTPAGPDANSWMLTCINNGVNRPFNANDIFALNLLY